MPYRSKRPCSYPGCNNLVGFGRCQEHQIVVERDPVRQRLYDRHWRARRQLQLSKQPWCEECLRSNLYNPATEVHHEQRHQGNVDKFIASPLVSLCRHCHSRITAAEVNLVKQGG